MNIMLMIDCCFAFAVAVLIIMNVPSISNKILEVMLFKLFRSCVLYCLPIFVVRLALPFPLQADQELSAIKPELIAEVSEIVPGQTFQIGLRFLIQDSWHIYWKNPGESGLATSFKVLSSGNLKIESFQWPAPQVFIQSGDLHGYGYQGTAIFLAKVTAPKTGTDTEKISIQARWLGCSATLCVPGQGLVEISLPYGVGKPGSEIHSIQQAMVKIPPLYNATTSEIKISPEINFSLEQRAGTLNLEIRAAKKLISVAPFVFVDRPFEASEPELRVDEQKAMVNLKFKAPALKPEQLPTQGEVVLRYRFEGEDENFVQFPFQIKNS